MSDNFILKDVVEFLHNILSYLNPFDENFILKKIIQGLADILNFLNPNSEYFIGKVIVDLLKDALNFLFVPSEDRINALVNSVKSKFNFVESIKITMNSMMDLINSYGGSASLSVTLKPTKYTEETTVRILDFSWYAQFKPYGDLVITGFVYALYLWRLFTHLPSIIAGAGGAYNDVPAMLTDLDVYSKFGNGRPSSTTKHINHENGGTYRR